MTNFDPRDIERYYEKRKNLHPTEEMKEVCRQQKHTQTPLERIAFALEQIDDGIEDVNDTLNFMAFNILSSHVEPDDLTIEYVQLRDGFIEPIQKNGAAYDLYLPEDVEIQAGETKKVGLGFACKLPEGYHAIMLIRSSSWERYGIELTNAAALFDREFGGDEDEWVASIRRPAEFGTPITIPAGTRITQFLLVKDSPKGRFVKRDTLGTPSRGGFGSTGK